MARMPGAEWVGEHGRVAMAESSLNKVCVHTIVGNPPAHAAHFSVRADGHIYQSRDTRFRSDANYYGNDDVIAIENDDHGPEFGAWNVNNGHDVPAFTPAQIEANARIIAWAYRVHDVPIVLCPDSKDASEGVAYHRQGVDGNFHEAGYAYGGRVAGGELWSRSYGKVCPGDRRITQLRKLIIPRARILARLDHEEDDMFTEADRAKLNRVDDAIRVGKSGSHTAGKLSPYIATAYTNSRLIPSIVQMLSEREDVSIDVNELATLIVAAQREVLEEIIREVVPNEIADDVVTRLGEKLSTA